MKFDRPWRPLLGACTVLALAAICPRPAAAFQDSYGSVTGQFVLDGDAPELVPAVKKGDASAKDAAVCAANGVPNEELVVDPQTGGIANIFIYMTSTEAKKLKIHPDLLASKEKEVAFDQKNCQFIPHCLLVRTDQTVMVVSDDNVAHNTHTLPIKNMGFNSILPPNDRSGVPVKVNLPELLPIPVQCDIHPWMKAYWLILDHPYAAVSDETGKFTIEGLPAGEHKFRIWQERVGYLEREFKIKVEPGKTTELAPIKIYAERLAKK